MLDERGYPSLYVLLQMSDVKELVLTFFLVGTFATIVSAVLDRGPPRIAAVLLSVPFVALPIIMLKWYAGHPKSRITTFTLQTGFSYIATAAALIGMGAALKWGWTWWQISLLTCASWAAIASLLFVFLCPRADKKPCIG